MQKQLPKVNCQYGAPMGRGERIPSDDSILGRAYDPTPTMLKAMAEPRKFSLQRIRLDSGGYDSGGAYWGYGTPLYWYQSVDGQAEGFLRATSREKAKAEIRKSYPSAKFFR
jgi:hypothetical protein